MHFLRQADGTGPRRPAASTGPRSDSVGVGVLSALIAVVSWNRLSYDQWLSRVDLLTFYLPWYDFLGDRLRAFDLPGWNPHLFSGTPFAGDPQSGWMYLPAMVLFPMLPAVAAWKTMVVVHLLIAGLSTYAFARVLGMRVIASLVAAFVFIFGPFLQHNTYCCTVYSQLATWIPVALLGIELALRAPTWRQRLIPWCLTGVALSQIVAGWLGQGSVNGVLLVGAYLGYRALLSPRRPELNLRARVENFAATGLAILTIGAALGAAGLLPRLDVNRHTNLAGGDYQALGEAAGDYPPWAFDALLYHILGAGYHNRPYAIGGVAVVLALLAPVVAGRRFGTSFFAGLSVVVLMLTLETTPLHQLFYLIPRFQAIHEHDPPRVVGVLMIGPAMLAAATVERLPVWIGRRFAPVVAVIAWFVLVVTHFVLRDRGLYLGVPTLLAFTAATAVVVGAALTLGRPVVARVPRLARWAALAPVVLLVLIFLLPTGQEIVESATGRPVNEAWRFRIRPEPIYAQAVEVNLARSDPGGAGAFLQQRAEQDGPFRYFGYAGMGYEGEGQRQEPYHIGRTRPEIQAILANARPIRLGLFDVQGYDPVQLKRYVEFIAAVNGRAQNYHTANVWASGITSPLLDLLDVRYVLIPADAPLDRPDYHALVTTHREVFRNDRVIVLENAGATRHAWIVHDARRVERGDALPLLTAGAVDPDQTALVEGDIPPLSVPDDPSAERVEVVAYEPERLVLTARATAPGLLVVSEVYDSGWRAYIDGEQVEILPANHVLRAVALPAGEHEIEFRYEPASLRIGVAISTVAWLGLVVAVVLRTWSYWRPRRMARSKRAEPSGMIGSLGPN